MILLTEQEIDIIARAEVRLYWREFGEDIAKVQLKKVAEGLREVLEDDAYYDHRIAAVFDYLDGLLKEVD